MTSEISSMKTTPHSCLLSQEVNSNVNKNMLSASPQLQPVTLGQGQPLSSIDTLSQSEAHYISLSPLEHFNEISNTATTDIKTMQQNDPDLQIIIAYLLFGKLPDDDKLARQVTIESNDYIDDNDILYHLYYPRGKGHRVNRMVKQLVIPLSLRNDILLAYHDALTGGHQGIERTYQSIRQKYFGQLCTKIFSTMSNHVYHVKNQSA